MSWVALATLRFDEVRGFYTALGGRVVDAWDREGARGVRLDLGGLRLEILDAAREGGLDLGEPRDRVHVVIEVAALEACAVQAKPEETSWGARVVRLRDPDGIPVTLLEWTRRGDAEAPPRA